MDFLEKDLEEIICNADYAQLYERGLDINGKLFRQLKIVTYGIADLVTAERIDIHYDNQYELFTENKSLLRITVYELKKDKIGISAFLQAIGYCKGIKRYLENKRNFTDFIIEIKLIGRLLDSSGEFCFLPDLF